MVAKDLALRMRSRKSFLPILVASALLLNVARNAPAESKHPRTDKHQSQTTGQVEAVKQQEPEIPISVWRSTNAALAESIRSQKEQSIAAEQQAAAYKETFSSPAVLVQMVLAIVGALYLVFAGLQWRAIGHQADIAEQALTRERQPYVYPADFTVDKVSRPNVRYRLKNYGFGPAFIENLMVICEPRDALKQPPSYSGAAIQFSTIGSVIGPNEANSTETISRIDLGNPDESTERPSFKLLFDGLAEDKLFLYGYVLYNDIYDKGYVTGFAAIWDYEQQRMRLAVGHEAEGYNYYHKIGKAKPSSLWLRMTRLFRSSLSATSRTQA